MNGVIVETVRVTLSVAENVVREKEKGNTSNVRYSPRENDYVQAKPNNQKRRQIAPPHENETQSRRVQQSKSHSEFIIRSSWYHSVKKGGKLGKRSYIRYWQLSSSATDPGYSTCAPGLLVCSLSETLSVRRDAECLRAPSL